MSFRSALVDQGRRLWTDEGTVRNDLGEYEGIPRKGAWYPVRLNPPRSTEGRGANQAARLERSAQVLMDKKLIAHAGDKLEIVSRELGSAIWILSGEPEPMRRRRALIGWVANVQRVENL